MRQLLHPSRSVTLGFLFAIVAGTVLLRLPLSQAKGEAAPWLTAFFTATSAVCVTGLVVVDTGTYWSYLRSVGHPGPVPDRRLRHDDRGHPSGAHGQPVVAACERN